MSQKILLTGASGFTGRHFISLATKLGYQCIALCHKNVGDIAGCSETYVASFSDKQQLKLQIEKIEPDFVVHLAAISFVAHDDCSEIYETNLQGTINLLDVLIELKLPIKKVLLASSGNVYGNNTDLPISEKTCISPMNDYAVSKVSMELAAKIRTLKLPILIVRPFNYTGVGQASHFLIPKIVAAFKKKQENIELGNLDVARDFSDVRDVVAAYIKLIESNVNEGVFNVCTGTATSLLTIIEKLNKLANCTIQVKVNPDFVRENEIKELYGSNQKLLSVIDDYQTHKLSDTLEWMYKE